MAAPAAAMDAADWTSQGGAVAEPGTKAMDISAGFPEFMVMGHFPLARHLEIDPFMKLFYWGDVESTGPTVGNALGARLKLNMVDRGSLQIALMADLAMGLTYYPVDAGFNMKLTFPQFIISGKVAKKMHLFGGIKLPLTFYVIPDIQLGLVIAGNFGMEFNLTDRLNLFVSVEGGPEIRWGNRKKLSETDTQIVYSKDNWSDILGYLSGSMGISVRF